MKVSRIVGLKLKEQYWGISTSGTLTDYSTGRTWSLENNVRSLEVEEYVPPSAGENKLTRSAAGAVLGFLVAGPIGTLAGAGIGAGGAKQPEAGSYDVSFVVRSPIEVIRAKVSASELRELQSYLVKEPAPISVRPSAAQPSPPPKLVSKARAAPKLTPKTSPSTKAGTDTVVKRKKIVTTQKSTPSPEMERKLAKLNFLRREEIITDEEWKLRYALIKGEFE